MTALTPYDAIVLAGGRSRRMNVADKTALRLGDRTLLDRAVAACANAQRVVVVGPARPVTGAVSWTREEPPGGGPAAAVAAGLPQVDAAAVVVLAADLPFVTTAVVDALVAALDGGCVDWDGVVCADDTGRTQWLCGAWRRTALLGCRLVTGASLHDTLGVLRFQVIVTTTAPPPWFDCDTPADLRLAEELLS
jgi:molybdopterin-guanine dinucleotide biosynthesis protein A